MLFESYLSPFNIRFYKHFLQTKFFTTLMTVVLYCIKRNFNFAKRKHEGSSCVPVQNWRGDLFELIPIPLEPEGGGRSGRRSREEAACGVEGGYSYAICQKGSRTREIPQFILPYVTPSQGNGR